MSCKSSSSSTIRMRRLLLSGIIRPFRYILSLAQEFGGFSNATCDQRAAYNGDAKRITKGRVNVDEKDSRGVPPVGSVVAWLGNGPPDDERWRLCNGDPLSKAEYPELFKVI